MIIAFTLAYYLGSVNWGTNTEPYYDIYKLSYPTHVDVASQPSTLHMDAGRILFMRGTKLDLNKTMAFTNNNKYCVAPIIPEAESIRSYDYWAVGLNCCSGQPGGFHCGDYDDPSARGGLRLIREDQRSFYRLAVEQAAAAYKVTAEYPLFFYWTDDPDQELDTYWTTAESYFWLGLLCFSAGNLIAVIVGVAVHLKTI
jgi:hypothetical protein